MFTPSLPHAGVFIQYEEVTGQRINIADPIHLLSPLNIDGVLRMIATLNACFVGPHLNESNVRILQEMLVSRLLRPEIRRKLEQSDFGKSRDMVVFHRQQQLLALRLALMACPDSGGQHWDTDAQVAFGEACLMINDLAGPRETETISEKEKLGLASHLLPISELPADNEFGAITGRAVDLWLNLPKEAHLQQEKDCIPWATRFADRYGISLLLFIQGLFVVLAQCERFDPAEDNPTQKLLINRATILKKSKFPSWAFKAMLDIVSCKTSALRDKIVTEACQSLRHDFTMLRRYPLLEVEPDIYLCYDRHFLRKYFTDGIYWLIFDLLSPEEKNDFQSFFGKVFATYIERLLQYAYVSSSSNDENLLNAKLRFADNQGEVCDVMSVCDDAWTVIETKGSLLTTRAKYSGNGFVLEQDIRSKFVQSRHGDKKGVGQLAQSIKKLLRGMPTNVPELSFEKCKRIYPVIVSYDSALSSPFIPQYLEAEFRVMLGDVPAIPKVLPLTIISAADVEMLTALKGRPEISIVLATYRHSQLLAESFGMFLRRHYHGQIAAKNSLFFSTFEAFCDETQKYFG